MANTMLSRNSKIPVNSSTTNNQMTGSNLKENVKRFAENLEREGINPSDYLNKLIKSGKVTQKQIDLAKKLAYASGIKL